MTILKIRFAYDTITIHKKEGHLLVTDTLRELPIDGWPDHMVTAIVAYLVTGGRLFLCLITVFTKSISDSKTGQAEAQHRYQSQNIHMAQPSFPQNNATIQHLCNQRVTVPPKFLRGPAAYHQWQNLE